MSIWTVEQQWKTLSGLDAAVIMTFTGHRCGYVAVKPDHPAYGKSYHEQLDCIKQEAVDSCTLGAKSPILAFTAAVGSDDEGRKVRRSLDILIEVHGGLTYSSSAEDDSYPVFIENSWWFGFNCAHCGDSPEIGGRSLDYCVNQCNILALQLADLASNIVPTS